ADELGARRLWPQSQKAAQDPAQCCAGSGAADAKPCCTRRCGAQTRTSAALPVQEVAQSAASGRAADLQMLAPVRWPLRVLLHAGLLVERTAQHFVQLANRRVVALFRCFNDLLRQVVAQNEFRVDRMHARPACGLVVAFPFAALAIGLGPAVEALQVDEILAQP